MTATVVICESACAVTLDLALPPLQLDTADGSMVGGAVLMIWAIGWTFRILIRSLRVDEAAPGDGAD
jgi:hypothetical protein